MPAANALSRFSDRVDAYIRYRPGYPATVLEWLTAVHGLTPAQTIIDIGSGTGISAELFLKNGNEVIGVEPNAEMRAAGDNLLAQYSKFRSVSGRAESIGLPDASADWAIAAQAFHWFDVPIARRELARVLRPGGKVALLWNDRRSDTPFLSEYDALLKRHATDYEKVDHRHATSDGRIDQFFGRPTPERIFPNVQHVDFDGLHGRLISSSYMPNVGQPGYAEMMADVRSLFERHQRDGKVDLLYDCRVFAGRLDHERAAAPDAN